MFRRGDPRPTGYAWRQMTLQKLQRAETMCIIKCEECGHEALLSLVWLAVMGNAEWQDTLYDVVQRCVCRYCGSCKVCITTSPDS